MEGRAAIINVQRHRASKKSFLKTDPLTSVLVQYTHRRMSLPQADKPPTCLPIFIASQHTTTTI